MAYVGLRKPYVAKYDRATKTYSNGFKYSHAVSFNINPNYAEASLYGDDMQVEYEKAFTNAGITLGTTSTPIDAAEVMFGHTIDRDLNKVIFKATDEANYVGVGIIAPEKVDGANKYVALLILSAKFADSAESFTTKGDQLQFNTPSIEGSAVAADDDGNWKITEVFDTEAAAEAFIKNYLNIEDPAVEFNVTQTLSHVTSSFDGDKIQEGETLNATLTADAHYDLDTVTVTMGGVDITATAYAGGVVSIAEVTGDVVITASAAKITHTVTQNLTNVTSDFSDPTVDDGASLEIILTEDSGYSLSTPTIEMDGVDITATAWDATPQKITIADVTGDVVITASAS